MAPWIVPALKAILPHLGTIVTAVTPVFTRKKPGSAAAAQPPVEQDQIAELQSAVTQNAANIKELATQLQNTVTALEQAAVVADARLRLAKWLSIMAVIVAIVSLAVAVSLTAGSG